MCFLGVENYSDSLSPVTFVSNMFVVCVLLKYFIGIISFVRCIISLLGMLYASEVLLGVVAL